MGCFPLVLSPVGKQTLLGSAQTWDVSSDLRQVIMSALSQIAKSLRARAVG